MTEQVMEGTVQTVEKSMKIKAPVLLFDLDRTLLDTQRMGELMALAFDENFSYLGVRPGDFQRWVDTYKYSIGSRTNFSLTTLAEHLHRQLGDRSPSSSQIEQTLVEIVQTVVKDCLYDDVLEAISTLKRSGCVICLYTQGVQTWQELKFAHTPLSELIDKDLQFVSADKASEAHLNIIRAALEQKGLQDREVWLIDDKGSILRQAKSRWPELQTIRMVRETMGAVGESAALDREQEAIGNLTELTRKVQILLESSLTSK